MAGLLLLVGCGGEDEADPAVDPLEAVRDAAEKSNKESTLKLNLSAESVGAGFTASGLLEPTDGRFRVEVEPDRSKGELSPFEFPPIVIGLDGEGIEATVAEFRNGFFPGPYRDDRCWFNPHGPVGSTGETISVEEATRLSGAILESLSSESIAAERVESTDDGERYEVDLSPSASRPRDDFEMTKRRVWGDRYLLDDLAGPIEVRLSAAGTLAGIAYTLGDYRPYETYRVGRKPGPANVGVSLAPTDREIELNKPRCQAIE